MAYGCSGVGIGNIINTNSFVKVNLGEKKTMSVAAGSHRSLFILEGGELRNAGLNHNGQLGIRNNTNTTSAVDTGHGGGI